MDVVFSVLRMPWVWVGFVGVLALWGLPKLYIAFERLVNKS